MDVSFHYIWYIVSVLSKLNTRMSYSPRAAMKPLTAERIQHGTSHCWNASGKGWWTISVLSHLCFFICFPFFHRLHHQIGKSDARKLGQAPKVFCLWAFHFHWMGNEMCSVPNYFLQQADLWHPMRREEGGVTVLLKPLSSPSPCVWPWQNGLRWYLFKQIPFPLPFWS